MPRPDRTGGRSPSRGGTAAGAGRTAGAQAPSPAPAPAANGQPPAQKASANGTVAQAAAPADPGELAWLVNEALIEQARRHGMDIS